VEFMPVAQKEWIMKTGKLLRIITTLAFVLSACADGNSTSRVDLVGFTWRLIDLNGVDPLEGHQPTIEFKARQVIGNTGCNRYGGSYHIEGDTIQFDGLFNTEMACLDTAGIMEQEQIYLELLRTANRFEQAGDQLTIFTAAGQNLVFINPPEAIGAATTALEPAFPTHTLIVAASSSTPSSEPPAGFNEYRDEVVGLSVYIPKDWIVTGIVEGQYAIIQSYPEDKYVGGEMLAPVDTKCDLNIRPEGVRAADLIQQWKSDPMATIISEEAFDLQMGSTGQRFVIDMAGRSMVFIAEIQQRVVLLTCFGDFKRVDEIAVTLKAIE
jgi:heat shock protein HslJ